MNGHLCLYLKPLGKDRKTFDKLIAECPVPGHDVLDIALKKKIDTFSDKAVAKIMKRPLVLRKIS